MPLMRISEYLDEFTPDSRPDPRTVRSWITNGYIYGEQRGRIWFVDPVRPVEHDQQHTTTNSQPDDISPRVRAILAEHS